ncbi:hypothetical protein BT96DRAFT_979176 [Gymnopus androsaceus JB14]|uniref:Wings apart-like protein C-terminal domain-containing protein n=1 Tax=Gymnopus androsaceus JB14 TaxID=1447944 RepID=A0A6A4H3Z4_9AGAR|nr:hypothetical protein BT96DRAFT_979176 [Gymnopus androsaceus JB14]
MSTARTYGKKGVKRKQQETESESDSPKRQKLDSSAARDLSRIFDAALAPSAPSTPTKLAKRMLGRSKTESSLDRFSYFQQKFIGSYFFAAIFSSLAEQQSSPQRPTLTNKRTYAGKSRSFLMAMPADNSLPEDDFNSRESYAALRSRWGVDNSEDDPYPQILSPTKSSATTPNGSPRKGKGRLKQETFAPADIIQPLKSITEIRNKGENRRFLDEVGYLLEGMGKDETPALRKASALEIVSRLCESDFARQAKAADFLQSTWDAFIDAGAGRGEDKVLDTLLASFTALVSRDVSSLTDLAQRDQAPSSSTSSQLIFTSTLFTLLAPLSPETDPLSIISQSSNPDGQLKKLGITKADRAVLKTLHITMASKARILTSKSPISNVLLLTRTLTTLPSTLLSCTCVAPLLQCLRAQLQTAIECLSGLEEDHSSSDIKPLFSSKKHRAATAPSLRIVPFAVIHDLLVLLDGYLLKQWAPSDAKELEKYHNLIDVARDEWLADGLVAVGITAELSSTSTNLRRMGKRKSGSDSSIRCTEIIFRVLVSLTHSDSQWAQTLTQNNKVVLFIVRTMVRADEMRRKIMLQTRRFSAIRANEREKNKSHTRSDSFAKTESSEKEDLTTDSVSEEEEEEEENDDTHNPQEAAQALDWLCLSLGLLTNLVQVLNEAKTTLRETMLDPECIQNDIPCICVCSCPNTVNLLNVMVTIYEHQLSTISPLHQHLASAVKSEPLDETPSLDDQEAEADASFLLGHLSVLFGLLMMDSPENQEIVVDALPVLDLEREDTKPNSTAASRKKVAQLIENASELGVFYAVISRRGLAGTRLDSSTHGDDNPFAPARDDQRTNGPTESDASRGADVAKEVISFLRELRDSV